MDSLQWQHTGGEYSLATPYGRAIISELDGRVVNPDLVNPLPYFAGRFEYLNGQIESDNRVVSNFEEVEAWLIYGLLIELDQSSNDASCAQNLTTTLDYCERLLQGTAHPTHPKRLELIRRILIDKNVLSTRIKARSSIIEFKRLDWQQEGSKYYINTDYGRAEIDEVHNANKWRFGGRSTFRPRLVDLSGVLLDGPQCSDFEEAEVWVNNKIQQLSQPMGDEGDYENLQHTIRVCIRLLPTNCDPMHFIRLEWAESRLADILL